MNGTDGTLFFLDDALAFTHPKSSLQYSNICSDARGMHARLTVHTLDTHVQYIRYAIFMCLCVYVTVDGCPQVLTVLRGAGL